MTVKIEHKIPSSAFIDAFNMMNIEFISYVSPITYVGCRLMNVKIQDDKGDIKFYDKGNFLEVDSKDFVEIEIYDNDEIDFITKNGDRLIIDCENAHSVLNRLKEYGYV